MRPGEGTLLPLWTFHAPRAKGRAVTALCWSPRHADLFAVGHGSYDCRHPTTGLVSLFTLKAPNHPELSLGTAAGVTCLQFHPDYPSLLAVGCYDGRLLVFDVHSGVWGACRVGGMGRDGAGGRVGGWVGGKGRLLQGIRV